MSKNDGYKVVLPDAIWQLPNDWYCDDCRIRHAVTGSNFEMCDECAKKPVPEDLVKKLKGYLEQKLKIVEAAEKKRKKPF